MKNFSHILLVMLAIAMVLSCNDYETYADMKEKERDAINNFISYKNIKVISEETFHANGNTTDVAANEYAYMNNTGVYMQIVRKGPGSGLEDLTTTELQIRFKEISIFDTTKVVTNALSSYDPDVMTVTKSGVNLTASFTSAAGTMLTNYGASVPSGWMVPLNIIRYDKHKEGCDWTFQHADLIFCLDFNTTSRVGDMQQALDSSPAKRVLIDHHLNPDVPTDIVISQPKASSTCELIFRLTWQLGAFEQQTKHFATPIYCGMMTDTGAFTYNSDSCDVYFIISQLLTKEINKDKIYRNVYHNFSENRLRLLGYVMYESLVVDNTRHASYFTLTKADLKKFAFIKGDAEGLVNMPLQIKGHRLSISLREDTEKENVIWVSLRSVDQFPCNEMAAQFFNGGGHLNASGGRLNCSMEEAVKITEQAIIAFEEKLNR